MTAEPRAAGGKRTARIEPLTRLATGGMADIWLAREVGAAGMERFVVVKRLLPHLAREPEIVDMFLSEARFIARLVHPNVVQIHDLGEDDEGYFLVMEYVAGCSVRELLIAASRARSHLPVGVVVSIIEQACRGAHAAHELADPTGKPLGLVHRDISPHNLMIGPSGDVKLLDFGIAKATAMAEATRTGTLKGKHGYMSPEQCRSTRVDRRSDVFALGIVCCELLTRERCFKRETEYATMEAIVHGDFTLPSKVRSELPLALDTAIAKALAVKLDERWPSAEAFRHALVAAVDDNAMRPSRDALAATMMELLGDRIDERERALRDAASSTAAPDTSALREVLLPSETSIDRPEELTSPTGSNNIATVVQRRSTRPQPEVEHDEPDDEEPTSMRAPSHVEHSAMEHSAIEHSAIEHSAPATEKSPELRARRSPIGALIALLVVAAGIVAAALWFGREQPTAKPAPSSASAAPAASSGPPLSFVVAPTVKPDVIRRELAPFLTWLGRKLHRPIEMSIAESYQATGEMVATGRADFGLLPPLLFVTIFEQQPRLQPLAVRLFDGSRASDGYLMVRDDSPLTSAADLRGHKVCHVDRTSTTGFLLPRIWMRKAGLDPDTDVSMVISGDHLAALRDLAAGKCDAAAVYSGAFLSARKDGIAVGQLRILAITGRVPQDTLVASPNLPAEVVAKLRDALLGFEPKRDVDAGRVGEVLGISGFAAFEPEEFDTIREAARQEGLVTAPDAGH